MKKLTVFIPLFVMFVSILPASVFAADNAPLTLKEAVLSAVAEHPSIKADKKAFQAQASAVKSARSDFFPSLDLSSDIGYQRVHNSLTRTRKTTGADDDDYRELWYNTHTLTLTQLVYDGCFTSSKYKAEGHRLESSRNRAAGSADQIALKTIESYMDVLRARKIIRFAQDNIAQLKDLRRKTRMRLEKGKGTMTDVNRVQLTLSDANAVLVNYQGVLQYAQDRFRANTGGSPDLITRQSVEFKKSYNTVEEAIDQALKENKALLMARSNIRQKESDLKTSKALYHPKVNFLVQATREENVDALKDVDNTLGGFLRVNYNLFRGGGDRATILENASLLSESRIREEELMLNVETKVRFEFNNMLTAKKQIPLLNMKIDQNIKVLESYKEQFLVGKRDIMDVIEAQKMMFVFQSALENMEIEEKLAQFRLLTITGQLFDTLGIQFNPES